MRLALPLLILWLPAAVLAADPREFVAEHCLSCHDAAARRGNVILDTLDAPSAETPGNLWLKVLQQVERRDMPPADSSQPSPGERQAFVIDLESQLVAAADDDQHRKPAVLRRLNRAEYRHTIRDLLQLNVASFDPTREFPDDYHVQGFATNGERLVTSSFLLRQYLEAAEQVVERALHFEPQPEVRRWDLRPPFDNTTHGYTRAEGEYFRKVLQQEPPYQTIYERMSGLPRGHYRPLDDLRAGMPVSGWYNVRILAEAKFRYANLDPKKMRFPSLWDPAEPLRLLLCTGTIAGIDPGHKEALEFAVTHFQAGQRDLAIWDLPDDQPTWFECRAWFDRGEFPRLGFPNGPTEANYRLQNYFLDNKATLLSPEKLQEFEADFKRAGHPIIPMWFESPRIRVSKIEIEGPLNDVWPPASHRLALGEEPYNSQNAAEVLRKFAERAWRRPAAAAEVMPAVNLVRAAEADGLTSEAAIAEGIKALLCSPEFLYREEQRHELNHYEIASRLSYFLWASMPDEPLLQQAAAGRLHLPEVRRAEALRLLADPRSDAFVEEFLGGWLELRKLGSMAPDVRKFAVYYDDDLESAMKQETRLFFRQILNTNGPIARFLDAETTIVNRELAALYGIDKLLFESRQGQVIAGLSAADLVPDAAGYAPSLAFAEVPVPSRRRGGLLGQASILTLTANGVDTSPVLRGIWLLENVLGAPPDPPPPDIPVIEPDIRGATTIRDQLLKHRESAGCSSCHKRIDPPGFALENFDAIGRWRDHYRQGEQPLPIDASGQFGTTEFEDVAGFKDELLARQDQFARCLVEKLLTFALGRELTSADRPGIRQILERAGHDSYRLKELVLLCVESELFCKKG